MKINPIKRNLLKTFFKKNIKRKGKNEKELKLTEHNKIFKLPEYLW